MATDAVASPRAGIGSTLHVRWSDGEEQDYVIVAAEESDPAAGRIAVTSPLAAAVAGRQAGETVTVRAKEQRRVLIVSIDGEEMQCGGATPDDGR